MVLENGVIEGRKTYTNIIKYLKLTVSSNFGNIFAVLAASIFLPFLPMLPLQLLILSLIYNIICIAMPWDNVDENYLKNPRNWDASSIKSFMFRIGPASTIFDIATYLLLFFVICPQFCGGHYTALDLSLIHIYSTFIYCLLHFFSYVYNPAPCGQIKAQFFSVRFHV